MKNLNLFRKSARGSEGSTLASAVVRPSFDRRSTVVKHLAFMLLFLLGSLNVWGADPVSWDCSTLGSSTITGPISGDIDANISFTSSKGGADNATAYNKDGTIRLYYKNTGNGSDLTLTPDEGVTITEVVLTAKSGYAVDFSYSIDGGAATAGSWSDLSATISDISATSSFKIVNKSKTAQLRLTNITITYSTGGGGKTDVTDEQLSWSAASATVTLGETPYSLPSLTNTIPVSVSYQSTDETVATISNMGVVSILKAGSTTIKAVYAGSETLNAKTVSYTLTVSPAPLTPIAGGIIDELVISDFGVTSGYTAFSDKQASNTGHSDAVYAGKVNKNSTNIQMNAITSTNTAAGCEIVTTTSGGYAKRVQAFWGGSNTNNRYLTVYGSNSAYTGSETATSGTSLGTITFHTDDEYGYLDINGDYPYLQIVASGAMYMSQINITWLAADESKVATPSIAGTDNFYPSTDVTITCGTDDADIYYTTDGTAPSTSSTKYTGVFSVNNTTTVKAIAIKEGLTDSEEAVATFTKITPLTVAEAIAAIPNKNDAVNNQYVAGIVCTEGASVNASGQMTYYISDDGSETNKLQIYKGKNLNNTEFSSVSDLAIGDRVVVFGQLKNFNNTPEMNDGNYLVSKEGPAVATPVFSPDGGGFMGETDVTITCATDGATIYYTLDNTTPSKSSTPYTGAIHLDATTTIKAIAYVGEESSLVVEKTFTLTAPMTVAEALSALDSEDPIENAAVRGIISTAPTSNPSSGRLTYYISDDGEATNELEVFNGFGLNGASFSNKTDLQVGDEVTVFGNLTIFTSTSTKEFSAGSRLLTFNRPTVDLESISLPATANVKTGKTITLTPIFTPVNATDKEVSWSSDAESVATVVGGVVTGVTAGTANITVTYNTNPSIKAVCEVIVAEAITFNDPTHEWQLVTSDAQLVAGKYYVLASTAQGKVMSNTISNSIAGEIAATFADGVIAYNAFGSSQSADAAGVAVLQLGGEEDAWTLTEVVANDALLGATAEKKLAWGSGTTTWSISIASDNATIQNGTSSYGRFLHNVNNTRFTTYTSNTSVSMLLPQLYVWAEKTYKLRYDANGGENAPAAQAADGEGKATVTDAKPTKEDYIFKEWNTLVGGDGEAKAAGDVIDLSAGDVTLYAQWRDPETVTVSYDANEGNGSMNADADQVEGSTYTIKTNAFERNGYLFAGWKAYDANDVELTITNGKFTVPATDVTVKAQWQSATDSKWVLVEHLSQLADGDHVIIAAADYDYALGAASGSVRTNVAVTKTGKLLSVPGSATELILGRNGNDFTFKDGTKYLNWASGNNLTTSDDVNNNSTWNITIENNATTIANKATAEREIQYNAQSPRFAAYTGSQKAVVIYKYLDMDPEDATSGYEREDLVLSGIGTICLPYDVKASDRFGGVFYMPSHKTSGFANFIEETGTLRAGKAYIFVAENEFIRLKYSGDAVSEPLSNVADTRGLIGTFTNIAPGNLTHKYVIANNKLMECGSGAYLNAYRAYLDLDAMPEEALVINDGPNAAPRRRLGVGGNAPQVATGVDQVPSDQVPNTKVLINGQLYIMYNGTMYNVQGQLVK